MDSSVEGYDYQKVCRTKIFIRVLRGLVIKLVLEKLRALLFRGVLKQINRNNTGVECHDTLNHTRIKNKLTSNRICWLHRRKTWESSLINGSWWYFIPPLTHPTSSCSHLPIEMNAIKKERNFMWDYKKKKDTWFGLCSGSRDAIKKNWKQRNKKKIYFGVT